LLCGQAEVNGAVVVPYGTQLDTHAWLHTECWPDWYELRRSQARQALTRIGLSHSQTPAGLAVPSTRKQ
jgi:hypothetical protein